MAEGKVSGWLQTFWDDDTGSVSIEYGLIGVIISLSIIAASQLIAIDLSSIFDDAQAGLANR